MQDCRLWAVGYNYGKQMSKIIHVAVGSTMSMPGDLPGNLRQIQDFASKAKRDGANLLLTPELSASGYGGYPEVLAAAEPAGKGPIYDALAGFAKDSGAVICAGFVESDADKRYLAHYVVYPNGEFVVQRKYRRTPAEMPLDAAVELVPESADDKLGQPAEAKFNYFNVNGVKCGLVICADTGIPNLCEKFAADGVELMLVPTGAGGKREDCFTDVELTREEGREGYLKIMQQVFFPGKGITDCIKYRRGLAAVNLCGFDGHKHYHRGHGMIINAVGEVAGFFHGQPNLDRQRPMYAHAIIDLADTIGGDD